MKVLVVWVWVILKPGVLFCYGEVRGGVCVEEITLEAVVRGTGM